jgi:hypothetical protein
MSTSVALDPAPLPNKDGAKVASRRGFGAVFRAAMEALVASQSRRFENSEPLFYRLPPY